MSTIDGYSKSSETARVSDQLRRTQQGSAWHGPALGELLEGVDAAQAQRRAAPGAHDIWELVLHIIAWQTAATRALEGQTMPALEGAQDWPAAGRAEPEWRETVRRLERANADLVAAVNAFPEARLEAQVPGREYSFYFLLHGVAQHNLYHAGQVALLKKLATA